MDAVNNNYFNYTSSKTTYLLFNSSHCSTLAIEQFQSEMFSEFLYTHVYTPYVFPTISSSIYIVYSIPPSHDEALELRIIVQTSSCEMRNDTVSRNGDRLLLPTYLLPSNYYYYTTHVEEDAIVVSRWFCLCQRKILLPNATEQKTPDFFTMELKETDNNHRPVE